jgi:hypothetical protein
LLSAIGTAARIGTGVGFGISGALNLANGVIDLERAYSAATSGSYNAPVEIIGNFALHILHTYTGIANIQIANALLFGTPTAPLPPSGLAVLRAAFASAGDNPILMGDAVIALSPAVATALTNAAGVFLAATSVFSMGSGQGGGSDVSSRIEAAVQEKLASQNDLYADATSLKRLSGPTTMSSNLDPLLGPNQVRITRQWKMRSLARLPTIQ